MRIHHDINIILRTKPQNSSKARVMATQIFYGLFFSSQFDKDSENFITLKERFNLEIDDYFQTGIMFFDTSIIKKQTKQEIINLAEEYPISITNEQGILNLYFIFEKNIYEDLPRDTNDGLVYFYWLLENKKIYITKQKQNKI